MAVVLAVLLAFLLIRGGASAALSANYDIGGSQPTATATVACIPTGGTCAGFGDPNCCSPNNCIFTEGGGTGFQCEPE